MDKVAYMLAKQGLPDLFKQYLTAASESGCEIPDHIYPFITGSYEYGQPGSDSDVDLVLPPPHPDSSLSLTNNDVNLFLEENSDDSTYPIRYSNLNLILTKSLLQWAVWLRGTQDLYALSRLCGPIKKEYAIAYFDALFIIHNLPKSTSDSGKPK